MTGSAVRRVLAIALVSAAVVLYEVAITRVLSVVLWYHFAFLAVSLALLGLGAPGVWFARRPPGPRALPIALVSAGVLLPASIAAITKGLVRLRDVPLAGAPAALADRTAETIASPDVLVTILIVLAPLLALGAAVCLLLLAAPGRSIGTMYGADLLGATVGAAAVIPLLRVVPTPALLAATGFLPLVAAALVSRRAVPAAVVVAALLAATLAQGEAYRLHWTKKYREGDSVLWVRWTPTARLAIFPDVFHAEDPRGAFAWGFGERWEPRPIEQLWLEQDGSAGTPITRWTGRGEDLDHLLFDVTSVAYQLRPAGRACVIGAGGGRDVLAALRCGARDVEAVELNPSIIEAVSGPFGAYSGDPYGMEGVTAYASEGRSHLARSDRRYDVVQISMVDSWAATAAGAYTLSENLLYTEEAFRLYWRRLTDDGFVSVSRWYLDVHLLEAARLVLLAKAALAAEGVTEPASHLAMVHAGRVATLLVSRRPFDAALLARLDEVCIARGFKRSWPPPPGANLRATIPRLVIEGEAAMADTGLDLSPPTDDRPFFFQTVPPFGRVDPAMIERLSVNEQSVSLLRRLMAMVVGLAVALFLVPFALWPGRRRGRGFWTGSAWFAGIGLAFLFVETSWIHRFILYLGHPSTATTVVLAGMLAGAGCGSLAAARVPDAWPRRLGLALPAAVLAIGALLGPVFDATLGWPTAARVVTSLALLLPPSFLMGFPFAVGMIRFAEDDRAWFWAMNGVFSVVAGVTSLALSMTFGYAAVATLGAALYVGVWALLWTPAGRPG